MTMTPWPQLGFTSGFCTLTKKTFYVTDCMSMTGFMLGCLEMWETQSGYNPKECHIVETFNHRGVFPKGKTSNSFVKQVVKKDTILLT